MSDPSSIAKVKAMDIISVILKSHPREVFRDKEFTDLDKGSQFLYTRLSNVKGDMQTMFVCKVEVVVKDTVYSYQFSYAQIKQDMPAPRSTMLYYLVSDTIELSIMRDEALKKSNI